GAPPPPPQVCACCGSSTPSPASKRPSGQTLVLPDMTVDTAIDIPDTWNNGYGASRAGGGPSGGGLMPGSAMLRAPMNDCSIRYEITERCDRTAALGRPVV